MTRYTLGFIFNKTLSKVLLIHKLTPDWQTGKVNGIGGKFESNETCYDCMVRETIEETGLIISAKDWQKIGDLHSLRSHVEVLTTIYTGPETAAKSVEKEQVEWFSIKKLPKNSLSNLTWLIPLCIDIIRGKEIKSVSASYK